MEKLLRLYDELQESGTRFYTWDLLDQKAVTIKMLGQHAIFMDFDNISCLSEEKVIVAHEGGHIATGATHEMNSPYDLIERHENRAWKWAIRKLIPKEDLVKAMREGYKETWDLAEYFDVTEDFIRKALCLYLNGNLNT